MCDCTLTGLISSMKKPIDMLEDLVDQDSFSYGTVGNTSYETLFRQSDNGNLPLLETFPLFVSFQQALRRSSGLHFLNIKGLKN